MVNQSQPVALLSSRGVAGLKYHTNCVSSISSQVNHKTIINEHS
jgi:hypothetical protein